MFVFCFVFFKQKTAYERRISDWSSDVCSSYLSALCPGKRGCDWHASDLARRGHASLLRIRLDRLAASADSGSISAECSSKDADAAAANGHLDVVRDWKSVV